MKANPVANIGMERRTSILAQLEPIATLLPLPKIHIIIIDPRVDVMLKELEVANMEE